MKIQDIETRKQLADFLNVPIKQLTYILYVKGTKQFYKSFEIPKKSGGVRIINAPTDGLKEIQRNLANNLYNSIKSLDRKELNFSHAFEKDKSIITNARIHRNKRYVLNIDLEDFFGSFHFGRVRGYFNKNNQFKLPLEIATVIAQLTTYEGKLPQGAPTSPIITNLISEILDQRISKIAKQYRLDYTRYADDLTFSTNDKKFVYIEEQFINLLAKLLERAGFKINDKKNRLQYKDTKQLVTGLVVNDKVNVEKVFYKKTRAMANQLYKYGYFEIDNKEATINQLEGRFSFINQLSWYNNTLSDKKIHVSNLSSRELQYQEFLFYKYFYANEKPIIVTEGKTDVSYLKSALKNLYKEYPELISKKEDNTFEFNVTFLNRTKRLSFLMNISRDGGNTLKNIYNFYDSKKPLPTYVKKFKEISHLEVPLNPVILLFDNELESKKEKPLGDFLDHVKAVVDRTKLDVLKDKNSINLKDNLYLLTVPLVKDKKECDIEDLFEKIILEQEVDGRLFSKQEKYDTSKFYGKEIFSKKVIQPNFTRINFENFKPILNNLKDIINNYEPDLHREHKEVKIPVLN